MLLGSFVSYYSTPINRINFVNCISILNKDYDYQHDDVLNPVLLEETNQTMVLRQALKILKIRPDDIELIQYNWGIGDYHKWIYFFIIV